MADQEFPPVIVTYDTTIDAPVEAVWNCISDFGGWCKWTSSFVNMEIEGDGVDRVGCVRKFQSAETKSIYEEREQEKDNVNHVFKFTNVSSSPQIVFLKSQLVTVTVTPDGDNRCSIHYVVDIKTNMLIPEDKVAGFQAMGKKTYDRMFGDLKNYVENNKKTNTEKFEVSL